MTSKSEVFIWNRQMELLSGPDLQRLQMERLRTLVERLQAKVPFYKSHLQGITSDKLKSLDDLKRLPFTTKSDLVSHYPFGLLAVRPAELIRIHASSGTKGKPNVGAYTKNDLSLWAEVCARSLATAGVKPGDVIQNSYHYGLFTGGLGVHYGAELLGAAIIPASSGRTQLQVSLMHDFGTQVICCTPSYALTISYVMEELGIKPDTLKLKTGIFGAEPWSEELRQQLQSRLKITALDIYGLTEVIGPGVAMECEHSAKSNGGLHVWEDHFLPEIIDAKTGDVLPEGEEGELVFTSMTREASPYLRYRTGDICRLNRTPCGCGRTMVRMSRVRARLDDMLIIRGVNVYPSEIERILLQVEELSPQYQLIVDRLKALDSLVIEVELTEYTVQNWGAIDDNHRQVKELALRVGERLRDSLGLMAEVVLLKPKSLTRSEGKAIRVIDKRTKAKEEKENGKAHGTL